MHAELTWFTGKRLVEAAKKDCSWFFVFSDGGSVVTESAWRLITKEGIVVTSEDDGHLFGLKEPVNSAALALGAAKGKSILKVHVADQTSDLTLQFEDEVRLEFLNLSCGYESWRAQHGSDEVICMGGGQLTIFSDEKTG